MASKFIPITRGTRFSMSGITYIILRLDDRYFYYKRADEPKKGAKPYPESTMFFTYWRDHAHQRDGYIEVTQ